jgi:peptide alpha-N-acetyltransferase
MLAVRSEHRGKGIATRLVRRAIDGMIARDAAEVVLETEVTNAPAMKLYERLGFLRSKRLHRYYLNGNSAFRLVLYLKEGVGMPVVVEAEDGQLQQQGGVLDSVGGPYDGGFPTRENGEYPGYHAC